MKFLTISLALFLIHPAFAAEKPEDFRYRYEVMATGLNQPMTMEMASDGKLYINELFGKLLVLDPDTKQITTVGELEVFTAQESGFLGFALDPNFAENGHIFIQHSLKSAAATAISRFTIKDGKLDNSSEKELLRWTVQRQECCHHAGEVHFGPDGNLYFSTGDNTSPFQSDGYTPIDERDGRTPFDAQKSAANTNDLRGKINRIRPTPDGGYTIPEGNLFKPGTPKTRPEIYAMGFRNPWRFTVDMKTGIVYAGDVGPDSGKTDEKRGPNGFDTLNQIRKPAHLGWPYSRGNEVYTEFDFDAEKSGKTYDKSRPINDSPNNTGLAELPPVTPPIVWYPGKESEQFPFLGSGGRTACAGEVYHFKPEFAKTGGMPEQYDGALLWFDWQRPFLLWAMLDEDSNFTGLEQFTESARVAQGEADGSDRFQIKRPVDTLFDHNGCLYVLDYGETWGINPDAQLVKVSYQRGNLNPVAKISLKNSSGQPPLTVVASVEATDPEGTEMTYEWVLQPSGKKVVAGKELQFKLDEAGVFNIEAHVTDAGGATTVASEKIIVGNTAPVVTFIEPKDGDFFEPGGAIPYKILIDDAEDGNSDSGSKAAQMKAVTLVTSEWADADNQKADSARGMTMMKHSGCFNCHAMDTKLVGPPLVEISNRYRGQKGAMDASADRVLKGSAGVWGEIPMLPHPQHTKDEIHMMVEWIFSLEEGKTGASLHRGTQGQVQVPENTEIQTGVLKAEFTDSAVGSIPALATSSVVNLRSRKVEAENADELNGPKVLSLGGASGGKGIGGMEPGHTILFEKVNLAKTSSITVRYTFPDGTRNLEIRQSSHDGELIGKIAAENSGGWDKWTEVEIPIKPTVENADLTIVVSGSINFDWLRFNK